MPEQKKAGVGGLLFAVIFYIVIPVVIMWVSGNWLWTEGLVFCSWFMGLCLYMTIWLFIINPYLFAERLKPTKANQKAWDKVFLVLLELAFFSWIVLMPLDASRFHWSPQFPVWIEIIGGLMLIPSAMLFIKCYIDNPFLSAVVRIQDDRGHKVVSSGVYGVIRHPMYLAGFFLFLGTPLLLGSFVGLGFTVLFVFGMIYRIYGEEKMLETELEGYSDYKKKVRFRLIPYIW